MELVEFATKVGQRFNEDKDYSARMMFAKAIAKRYKFEFPEIVLFFTHPTLSKLPFSERCKKMSITEEQYLYYAGQAGMQKFIREMETLSMSTLRVQSFDKLGEGIQKDRYRYDKLGNQMDDYSVETEIMKAAVQEKVPIPQVNVQMNIWDKARSKAAEMTAIEVK